MTITLVSPGNKTVTAACLAVVLINPHMADAQADPQTQDPTAEVPVEIELSWAAPTTRTDKTHLNPSEIECFRIYYGQTKQEMALLRDIKDGRLTRYTITDLTQGGYYFGMTAYDVNGLESDLSEIVYKEAFPATLTAETIRH